MTETTDINWPEQCVEFMQWLKEENKRQCETGQVSARYKKIFSDYQALVKPND